MSDGVSALSDGEVESIVIAGMGGELTIRILTEGESVCRSVKELILQPQSDIQKVCKFLREHGYRIVVENMVYEEQKYYSVMKVIPVEEDATWDRMNETVMIACDRYGPLLLKNGNPVLRKILVMEHKKLLEIEYNLEKQIHSEQIVTRLEEIREQLECNESAYTILGDIKDAGI